MHLIERTPVPCVVCGSGNVVRNDGTMPRFVDFERDVNWNDPVVMCEDCLTKAGAMIDLLTNEERQEMERELKAMEMELHTLQAEMEENSRRTRAAIRRARAAA